MVTIPGFCGAKNVPCKIFSFQSIFKVIAVCLRRFFPVLSQRHWQRRRHFHSATLCLPFPFEDKLSGTALPSRNHVLVCFQ